MSRYNYLEIIDECIKDKYSEYGEFIVSESPDDTRYMVESFEYSFRLYSKSLGQEIGKIYFHSYYPHSFREVEDHVSKFFEFHIDDNTKRRMLMSKPLTLDQLKTKSKKKYKFIRPVRF